MTTIPTEPAPDAPEPQVVPSGDPQPIVVPDPVTQPGEDPGA